MYVETDIAPIVIDRKRIGDIKRRLPESPEQKIKRFTKDYGLSKELAGRMSTSENAGLFEELVKATKADSSLIASTLEETLVNLRREGAPIENIQKSSLNGLFMHVSRGKLMKEAIPEILKKIAMEPQISVGDAIKNLGLAPLPKSELKTIILKIISQNEELIKKRAEDSFGALMGTVMKEVRGKADGQLVSRLLQEEIKRYMGK